MSKSTLHRKLNRESHPQRTVHLDNSPGVLQEHCRTLSSILQSSPLAIVTLDSSGTVQTWNPAAEQMFGWTQAEVLGYPLPVVPQDEEVHYRRGWNPLLGGLARSGEQVMARNKDGFRFSARVSSAPLFDENGHVEGSLYIFFESPKDSPRGRADEHLKPEALNQLARGLAHELNNSLGAILGWAELALDGLDSESSLRKPLNHILQQARHANEVIQDLSAFSRTQALQMYNVNLNQVVEQAVDRLSDCLPRGIILKKPLASSSPRILADPEQIERVLLHICRYVQQAVPKGGHLQIETRRALVRSEEDPDLAGVPPGNYAIVCISHTGLERDRETLKHLFEPFFELQGQGNGSGMALAAASGIVRQHGGWIRASSEPDSGTRFTVYFPLSSDSSLLIRQAADEE